MRKPLLLVVLLAACGLVMSYGQQTGGKKVLPISKTDPTNGRQMFVSYCAPCHGIDGRGNGPTAPALKTQPSDLTILARMNHGKYPDTHVASVLQFGVTMPAHGSAAMPVWGPILGNMNRGNVMEQHLRIANLSSYLRSIQTK